MHFSIFRFTFRKFVAHHILILLFFCFVLKFRKFLFFDEKSFEIFDVLKTFEKYVSSKKEFFFRNILCIILYRISCPTSASGIVLLPAGEVKVPGESEKSRKISQLAHRGSIFLESVDLKKPLLYIIYINYIILYYIIIIYNI